ncbi:MAG TPA: glutamine synthetase family protein [Puia sp.]|jgi:glutamine synthetase|nr:glutamine synthetase family protein [Puia sp.]
MNNRIAIDDLLHELELAGTEKVKLAITDIDGVLRGKVIGFDKFKSIVDKGFGFCDVVFGWDAGDQAYDNGAFTGWHTGYPDALAVVDVDTMRRVPWEAGLPFFLADFGAPVCPRGLLKKVVRQAKEEGYTAYFSQEFEWFNFIASSDDPARRSFASLKPMTQGMFGYSILRASQGSAYFHALFDELKKFGVPLEGLHTETGPGVYEAAILYSEVMEAADRAVLFKSGVKEIAYRHGVLPTFMAKVSETLPGCSGHVHQSLWRDGVNLFHDPSAASGMSQLMESYMAGQLYCLPDILPMVAPTVNSYKRLVEGAWAPTTPTWAVDNRTTALRALPGSPSSTRLETRVVGSDANPYLAMAACLAAGLYGVRKGLRLTVPATKGSGYADKSNGVLPRNLWDATQAMKVSPLARELFGEAFTDHFVRTREWEWRQFGQVVTDWELKRYFEII